MYVQPKQCKACGVLVTCPGPYCGVCEYMTQIEAAKRLHLSMATYYRRVSEGMIKTRRIGPGKVLVSRAEIDALLSGRRYPEPSW